MGAGVGASSARGAGGGAGAAGTPAPTPARGVTSAPTPFVVRSHLLLLTLPDLRDLCANQEVPSSGTKPVVVDRLVASGLRYSGLVVEDLKEMLECLGLDRRGKKADLIARLVGAPEPEPVPSSDTPGVHVGPVWTWPVCALLLPTAETLELHGQPATCTAPVLATWWGAWGVLIACCTKQAMALRQAHEWPLSMMEMHWGTMSRGGGGSSVLSPGPQAVSSQGGGSARPLRFRSCRPWSYDPGGLSEADSGRATHVRWEVGGGT